MRKKEFYDLFQDIKNTLCMQDVEVEITFTEKIDEGVADRQFVYKRHWIDFNEELLMAKKDYIVSTIAHELLHYYLSFREPFIDSLQQDFNRTDKEAKIAGNGIIDLEELVVTNLERAFTNMYMKLHPE